MKLFYGDRAAREVSGRIAEATATMTTLAAIPSDRRVNGMICHVLADNTLWQFNSTSALTADTYLVAGSGTGRWLRMPGACKIVIPITFATADAAILLTFPAGSEFKLDELWWDATADWTGGASSTIGVSSSTLSGVTTKGDLLGGAAGSLAAALTAAGTPNFGTIGAQFDTLAKRRPLLFNSADTIRHDRITSAFTAGTGNLCLAGNLLKNLGA